LQALWRWPDDPRQGQLLGAAGRLHHADRAERLRQINGPEAGRRPEPGVVVDGAAAGSAEKLAFVFQGPTLLPWLSVQRNVEVPLRLNRTGRAERSETVRRALELVRLSDRTGYYPRQL